MKYNALAVMALANGLAQAHHLNWQSESQAVVEHERRESSGPAFKIDIGEKHGKKVDNDVADKTEKKGDDEHVELVIRGSKGDIKSKVSTSTEAEKKKLKELKEIEAEEEEEEEEEKNHYDDPYPHDPVVTSYPKHYNHRGHRYEGKKYDFTHEPKVYHHTSYIIHEPKLSPDCHGDRCDRKPCNKCNGNWAQPGCWHCKNHEQENAEEEKYEKVTSTGEAAPEKTKGKYYNAKTYTYGDRTIIVPKETKAPKPEETYKKEGPKIVVIEKPVVVDKPKHEYPKEKPKVVVIEKPKHEYPKHEHKEVDICKQIGQHKHGENPCDKIQHHKQEHPKPEPPKVHYKNPDIICEGGCNIHQGAAPAPAHPQPEQKKYEDVKPMPAPVPAPAPPAPAPQQPKHHYGQPRPAPAPAPAPAYPQPEHKKHEEIKPVPAPAPVPAKPEVVKPEAGNGNAPVVPVTVPKSGANYVAVSVGTAVFAGFVSMMLL